jgi:hypothetical protein
MRAIDREAVLEALLETAGEIESGSADTAAELTPARVLR